MSNFRHVFPVKNQCQITSITKRRGSLWNSWINSLHKIDTLFINCRHRRRRRRRWTIFEWWSCPSCCASYFPPLDLNTQHITTQLIKWHSRAEGCFTLRGEIEPCILGSIVIGSFYDDGKQAQERTQRKLHIFHNWSPTGQFHPGIEAHIYNPYYSSWRANIAKYLLDKVPTIYFTSTRYATNRRRVLVLLPPDLGSRGVCGWWCWKRSFCRIFYGPARSSSGFSSTWRNVPVVFRAIAPKSLSCCWMQNFAYIYLEW